MMGDFTTTSSAKGSRRGIQGSVSRGATQAGGAHLHGVVGVLVVEDERLLDELVVTFLQLVDLGL